MRGQLRMVRTFGLLAVAGGAGAFMGSVIGAQLGGPALFVGALLGGLVASPCAALLAGRMRWIDC
jgi:hypothetical protein